LKYEPKDYLVYKHDSGEMNFVKRNDISYFAPTYTHPRGYTIFVGVNNESKAIHRVDTLEEAEKWCLDQIQIIEFDNPKREKVAREKANG
jgi:hypothetical protein